MLGYLDCCAPCRNTSHAVPEVVYPAEHPTLDAKPPPQLDEPKAPPQLDEPTDDCILGLEELDIVCPLVSETPSHFCAQQSVRSKRGTCRRSASTECLRSGNAEWWVIRPPQSPLLGDQEGSDAANLSSLPPPEIEDPPETLRQTWCGEVAMDPDTPTTGACQRGCFSGLRRKAAGRRYRYEWNGFDLDLAYITSRVVAMGFPSRGHRAAFRNPQSEVDRFLRANHKDHFRIYNLCDEKAYATNGFPNETVHFACPDHCPPPLRGMRDFCQNVESWLRADDGNIVSVHCKAGKGRTGTMICALLVYAGAVDSAYQALRWYEQTRGGKWSGVTIPDQIRWVAMLERYLKSGSDQLLMNDALSSKAPPHRLISLRMGPLSEHPAEIIATVGFASRESMAKKKMCSWLPEVRFHVDQGCQVDLLKGHDGGPVWTDSEGVLVMRLRLPTGRLKLRVWWHYAFLQESPHGQVLHVTKEWIGGLQKDVIKNKLVPRNFHFFATFVGAPCEQS